MGKTKQVKEKKFDRNVEISAPILDPEIIKAIHTPPKGQRPDIKHGGFKALLSDLNSQDSIDELTPLNDNHVPSYIGISCAVSGYSNYSSYSKRSAPQEFSQQTSAAAAAIVSSTPNRSRTNSPLAHRMEQPQIHHITIDKNNIHSVDEERRELTEKLTASVTERRRSPSPCIPPTEDDRHHGAYVGARYCPLPPPSKVVNKHIPLLGIDDEQDPDTVVEEDAHTVEQKIASLYGGEFVEDWRESQTHKAKKELPEDQTQSVDKQPLKTPKDLVTLKPTPLPEPKSQAQVEVDVPTPDVKVLATVEKQFLTKLLTDDNPPKPTPPSYSVPSPPPAQVEVREKKASLLKSPSPPTSPIQPEVKGKKATSPKGPSPPTSPVQPNVIEKKASVPKSPSTPNSPSPIEVKQVSEELEQRESPQPQSRSSPIQSSTSPVSTEILNKQLEEEITIPSPQLKEEHINYEIRTESPVNNESSPVRHQELLDDSEPEPSEATEPLKPLKSLEHPEPFELLQSMSLTDSAKKHETTESFEAPMETNPIPERAEYGVQNLVSFSPEPLESVDSVERLSERQVDIASVVKESEAATALVSNLETMVEDMKDSIEDVKATFESERPNVERVESMLEKEADKVVESVENKVVKAVEKLSPVSDSNDGRFYLELLDKEKSFILKQIERAQAVLDEKEAQLDEDTLGRIRSAIGKANLLINKKCNQFRELCEANMSTSANEQYATLNDDLAGFWDMLSIQVTDVRKSFESLWQAEESEWSNNE